MSIYDPVGRFASSYNVMDVVKQSGVRRSHQLNSAKQQQLSNISKHGTTFSDEHKTRECDHVHLLTQGLTTRGHQHWAYTYIVLMVFKHFSATSYLTRLTSRSASVRGHHKSFTSAQTRGSPNRWERNLSALVVPHRHNADSGCRSNLHGRGTTIFVTGMEAEDAE